MWPISAINVCFWLLVMTRVLSPQYWGILVTFCRSHLSLVLWRWKLSPPTEPRSPKATKSWSLAVPAVEGSRTPISGACCSERSRKSGTQASHQKYLLKINLEAVTGKLVFNWVKFVLLIYASRVGPCLIGISNHIFLPYVWYQCITYFCTVMLLCWWCSGWSR